MDPYCRVHGDRRFVARRRRSGRATDFCARRRPFALYLCIAALAFTQGANASTRIGIIRFSDSARIERFPTLDRAGLQRALDALPQPDGGTAIGDALLLAGRSLPTSGRRAVFLITDGANNRGTSPDFAIATLRALHVSVYAAGVGGGNSFDERALRRYARAAGGSFASATMRRH